MSPCTESDEGTCLLASFACHAWQCRWHACMELQTATRVRESRVISGASKETSPLHACMHDRPQSQSSQGVRAWHACMAAHALSCRACESPKKRHQLRCPLAAPAMHMIQEMIHAPDGHWGPGLLKLIHVRAPCIARRKTAIKSHGAAPGLALGGPERGSLLVSPLLVSELSRETCLCLGHLRHACAGYGLSAGRGRSYLSVAGQ